MKGTILYAEYDEGTGVSTVTKQTKYGTFTRSVRVHESDQDIANQYDGCFFAEMKCDIAAYKERAKIFKARADGIWHAYHVIVFAEMQRVKNSLEKSDQEVKTGFLAPMLWNLDRQAQIADRDADNAYETYTILKDSYSAFVETSLRNRRYLRKKISKFYSEK